MWITITDIGHTLPAAQEELFNRHFEKMKYTDDSFMTAMGNLKAACDINQSSIDKITAIAGSLSLAIDRECRMYKLIRKDNNNISQDVFNALYDVTLHILLRSLKERADKKSFPQHLFGCITPGNEDAILNFFMNHCDPLPKYDFEGELDWRA
jgi:hypothetical protein